MMRGKCCFCGILVLQAGAAFCAMPVTNESIVEAHSVLLLSLCEVWQLKQTPCISDETALLCLIASKPD